MNIFTSVTGVWHGTYRYDAAEHMPGRPTVPFALTLRQGWLGRFSGTVTDDETAGMPGVGTITGWCWCSSIRFLKQMPVCYVVSKDAGRISLREFLAKNGLPQEHDSPHAPIHYRGQFADHRHASGTWIIQARVVRLPEGRYLRTRQGTGTWTMEKTSLP